LGGAVWRVLGLEETTGHTQCERERIEFSSKKSKKQAFVNI
jgi:hypothetical protein